MRAHTITTVSELIDELKRLDPNALVGALGPSSLTAFPLFVSVREDGVVELAGDDMSQLLARTPSAPKASVRPNRPSSPTIPPLSA